MLSCTSEIWEKSASLLSISLIISATAVYAIVAVLGFSKTNTLGAVRDERTLRNSQAWAQALASSPHTRTSRLRASVEVESAPRVSLSST